MAKRTTIPSKEHVLEQLPPELRKLYSTDEMVVVVAKAFPYYQKLIESLLRNLVNGANLETIAPVQLAGHTILRGCELFADRGEARMAEIERQKSTPE